MSPAAGWLMLVGAGLLDVGWALATKEAQGFSRPAWSFASLVLLAGFVLLVGRAMRVVDVGVAYTVATGVTCLVLSAFDLLDRRQRIELLPQMMRPRVHADRLKGESLSLNTMHNSL